MRREIFVFILVGSVTFLVDYLVYSGMMVYAGLTVEPAKVFGIVAGTMSAYFMNRFWTFRQTHYSLGSIGRFLLLYLFTLGLNVFINTLVLSILVGVPLATFVAFTIAAVLAASLNFVGMRYFVFKTHKNQMLV